MMTNNLSSIQFFHRFHFYTGAAYGTRQAAMAGVVRVSIQGTDELSRLDAAMARYFDSELPAERERNGPVAAQLMDKVAGYYCALQREYDIPVFGSWHIGQAQTDPQDPSATQYRIVLPYAAARASAAAIDWLTRAVNLYLASPEPLQEKHKELDQAFKQLTDLFRSFALPGTNNIHFAEAAYALDIPVRRILRDTLVFGSGQASRWLSSSISDETPSLGVRFAKNKQISASILRQHGLPAPTHILTHTEAEAIEAAEKLGYPVVVKPIDLDQGRGVFAGLKNAASLRSAYRMASKIAAPLLVEKHHFGEDYRFNVFHGQVLKIMHRKPGGVTGDGKNSIEFLLAQVQQSPNMQKALQRTGKMRLQLDSEARELLEEQGLNAQSVPAKDSFVPLRRKSNISSGGAHELASIDSVHPDNLALVIRAARVLGLDFAGIDLLIPDPRVPWHQSQAIICEVNAQPQIGYRHTPDIYKEILRKMMPDLGRIPLHLAVFSNAGSDKPVDLNKLQQAAKSMAQKLSCNAFSTGVGAWVNGTQTVWRPKDAFFAAWALLLDKQVTSALLCLPAEEVLRFGLPASQYTSVTVLHEPSALQSMQAKQALDDLLGLLRGHSENVACEQASFSGMGSES